MVPQKPHGRLRFGVQIPPCHEMPFESLCFSGVVWFVGDSACSGMVSGQRHWKEGASPHAASGLQASAERPFSIAVSVQPSGEGTGSLGTGVTGSLEQMQMAPRNGPNLRLAVGRVPGAPHSP